MAFRRVVAITLIGMALLMAGCGQTARKVSGKILVAASIAPLANWCREVGGNLVEVELLVPPGASPHIYQPTPNQMRFLSNASVLVLNGIHLEFWASKAIDAANNPKLLVVRTAEGLPIIGGSDPDHPGGNPHVWLDPINAIHQISAIRDAFIKADPKHKSTYEANTARYIARLKKLDSDIKVEVSTFKVRSFIAFHPAWVYFARRYGLDEVATLETSPGREPSAIEMKSIIDMARKLHAKAIFAEPQFSPKAAETIADESGAKVLYLDPLGRPPDYDYIKTMQYNLREMSKALK